MDKNAWLIKLSEEEKTQFWKVEFGELSAAEKVFVAIWGLEADVNNGGFSQYYFNSAGDHAMHAPGALRAIGANAMADIVTKANAQFGAGGPPVDWEERRDALEALRDKADAAWDELSGQFQNYPDDLTELLYAYVQANKSQIRGA
jgi:Domain of unknown function (DUF4375)